VFVSERGTPFSPDGFNWLMKRAGQKAGLPFQVTRTHSAQLSASGGPPGWEPGRTMSKAYPSFYICVGIVSNKSCFYIIRLDPLLLNPLTTNSNQRAVGDEVSIHIAELLNNKQQPAGDW
jgi:hypothetical protein